MPSDRTIDDLADEFFTHFREIRPSVDASSRTKNLIYIQMKMDEPERARLIYERFLEKYQYTLKSWGFIVANGDLARNGGPGQFRL